MSWHPEDLVTDADLEAYESQILSVFGVLDWTARRTRVLDDWLWPRLRARGMTPERLRTRYEPDAVQGYTDSAYTDYVSAATSATVADVPFATIFATVANDRLYIGSTSPFRGVFVRLLDSVSAVTSTLTVAYWGGAWLPVSGLIDQTDAGAGKTLSKGGSVTWDVPADWTPRMINSLGPYYWVYLSVSATPTAGTSAAQLAVIRASVLRAPVVFKVLAAIFRGAPIAVDGPWPDRMTLYDQMADDALETAWPLLGAEFDTDESDQVSATEAAQTADEVASRGGWTLERA